MVTLLDEAIVPDEPEKPNKKLIVIIGLFLGVFIGTYAAFVYEFIKKTNWSKLKGN